MKIAIIADDFTGANDSGVQLAKQGLKTSVILSSNFSALEKRNSDVVVFDTDSRSLPMEEAYRKVRGIAESLKNKDFDLIYKKMDSTLRGNLGAEIDAVYEAFQPDFVIISPAFPKNGRLIKDGFLYVNGNPVHETEVGRDPKTPVTESFIPDLLMRQSARLVGLITCSDYAGGPKAIFDKLALFKERQVPYVVFDAMSEQDLQMIANAINETVYSVVWAGSAGLVNYLLGSAYHANDNNGVVVPVITTPILLVVGSVSRTSRLQLNILLTRSDVAGIEMKADLVLGDDHVRVQEIKRVQRIAFEALSQHHHVVIYSSGEPEDIRKANEAGRCFGLDSTSVSNLLSSVLGTIAARLMTDFDIRGLVLTGGDTAKQVCDKLGYAEFELINEVEAGVPIGCLIGRKEIYAVTKAGSFGTDDVLSHSINKLTGQTNISHSFPT
ncbi:four-carbon acid sugar kinase family protein [Paenibacillus sp. BR2-3]|uniref:four-carbon acid sugar kinase family protein n=1 Tax=Paenibacillus sp. BR2-3 TaxID=3048494 RepID=UPI003977A3D7